MIRGTTPKHIFNLPFEASLVKEARISYAQEYETVLTKTEADCVFEGNTITVALTQEDTLLFKKRRKVEIQLRVLTTNNEVMATVPYKVELHDCLTEEVLQ